MKDFTFDILDFRVISIKQFVELLMRWKVLVDQIQKRLCQIFPDHV